MRPLSSAIIGICVLLGLALAGYLIGQGSMRFRTESKTVTVKGLAEREVKADQVIWKLPFRRAGDDIKDVQSKISRDRDAILAFLQKQGIAEDEVSRESTRTIDKQARDFLPPQSANQLRFIASSSLVVKTSNVDRVRAAIENTDELLKAGILLDGTQEGSPANPTYLLSKFNELRPQLLAEATKNARATAEQFATDGGTHIGGIRSANQGVIQIFGTAGNDESGPYSPTSSPTKRVRVVSTFEFELR